MGSSTTAGGQWANEANRRLTAADGEPKGLGFKNINFIGTCKKENTGYELFNEWAKEDGYSDFVEYINTSGLYIKIADSVTESAIFIYSTKQHNSGDNIYYGNLMLFAPHKGVNELSFAHKYALIMLSEVNSKSNWAVSK